MSSKIRAYRYHDFSYGHRVYLHESKCSHLHGHNGRVHFTIEGEQDAIGRILDFGVINFLLCQWVEQSWDHKFLVFADDDWRASLSIMDPGGVVVVPFNPTAENMADHLLRVVGPEQLKGTTAKLISVTMEETRKCSASASF